MKEFIITLTVFCFIFCPYSTSAQRIDKAKARLEAHRAENWPPKRVHYRNTLGYALQQKFKRHAEFCGFGIIGKRRDYVPDDISKFVGKRNLRTKVETANIRGGSLLSYIFKANELKIPFNSIQYSPSRIFKISSLEDQFVVNPDASFDSFILTKNCSGYLKASLDAGIEPPYSAFAAALQTDDRKESSIVALSGSFISPLKLVLDANDQRTMETLLNIWSFYKDHPAYAGQAYYLQEFEGVMIRHLSTAEENLLVEREVGLNINLPLVAHLNSNLGISNNSKTSFSGSDWETIVFADFTPSYRKEGLFAPLPSPTSIREYFETIQPTYERARDFPLMTEGVEHRHFLTVEGIPEHMTQNYWVLDQVSDGVYEGQPNLQANYYYNAEDGSFGCRFTIIGQPLQKNFRGPKADRPSKLNVSYKIRSREAVGGEYLVFHLNHEIQTSSHPTAKIMNGEFDLSKKEDRRFAFQWTFDLVIEDRENPVNFKVKPFLENLVVRQSNKTLDITVAEIRPLAQQGKYEITLETQETFTLDRIDDRSMHAFNLTLDAHLPMQRTANRSVRPLKSILHFPSIRSEKPAELIHILQPQPVEPSRN